MTEHRFDLTEEQKKMSDEIMRRYNERNAEAYK
jgi:hypothetical protein